MPSYDHRTALYRLINLHIPFPYRDASTYTLGRHYKSHMWLIKYVVLSRLAGFCNIEKTHTHTHTHTLHYNKEGKKTTRTSFFLPQSQ